MNLRKRKTTNSSMDELEGLLAELGLENIRPQENEVYARCPLHQERTGKRELRTKHWSINRFNGKFFCFSCGYKGTLLKLVVDMTHQSPWQARMIIRRKGLDFLELEPGKPDGSYEIPIDLTERLECFISPPATALHQRSLSWPSVSRYGVRWDREDNAWVLPIRGPGGLVWGYQTKSSERVLNHPSGVRKSRTLFGLDILLEQPVEYRDYVLLVESPLDCVYLDGFGYPAVASFGCAVSDQQIRLLVRDFARTVLALDNDDAGRREITRLLKTNWPTRQPIEILNYGNVVGKDPGEMSEPEIETALETAGTSLSQHRGF
jgi:hypothetical protein